MLRYIASAIIVVLFALNLALPETSIGRRGTEHEVRADVAALQRVGTRLPDFQLSDLDGEPVTAESLLGHRVLLTFERSVDW